MSKSTNILLVEDETNVALTLFERLEREGYRVFLARGVGEAKDIILSRSIDLALLDIGLPDGSGIEVGQFLRTEQSACAVIFLTAYGDPEDRVRGLEVGAEDYVVKPFHFKELLLRIRNGLKRVHYISGTDESATGSIMLGRAQIFLTEFKARVDGTDLPLTHKECALLRFLLERRGKVVSRDEILNFVWSHEDFPTPRTVDNFIVKLRKLIEFDPDQPELIKSIRGVGYQLN